MRPTDLVELARRAFDTYKDFLLCAGLTFFRRSDHSCVFMAIPRPRHCRIPDSWTAKNDSGTVTTPTTTTTGPELVTDEEREFLMPIVRYFEILLEWSREREAAAATPSAPPVSSGQPQEPRPARKPRKKNSRLL